METVSINIGMALSTGATLSMTSRMVLGWRLGQTIRHLQVVTVKEKRMVLVFTDGLTVLNMQESGPTTRSVAWVTILGLTIDTIKADGVHQQCMALDVISGLMVADMTGSMLRIRRKDLACICGRIVGL